VFGKTHFWESGVTARPLMTNDWRLIKRFDERGIPHTTISHEILDTITLTDPNGIILELSVWNIDPKGVQM
jgi:hypothetical protein